MFGRRAAQLNTIIGLLTQIRDALVSGDADKLAAINKQNEASTATLKSAVQQEKQ